MKKIKPLFMWAGGKTKMLKYHLPYLIGTKSIDSYSEPFFGGGAMFLYIAQRFKPKHIYINDINDGIMNIYKHVKESPDDFCGVVDSFQAKYIPLSEEDRKEYFLQVRHAHAYDFNQWTRLHEAGALYFLMKTGFNGIWQINKNTNGRYGTPAGLLNQVDTVYDKGNVMMWSELLQNATITCNNYSDCKTGEFNYFDPPYRNSFTKYGTAWDDDETKKLVEYVKGVSGRVMLCNRCDGSTFFDDIKGHLNIARFPVTYTAGRRKITKDGYEAKPATEILLYS